MPSGAGSRAAAARLVRVRVRARVRARARVRVRVRVVEQRLRAVGLERGRERLEPIGDGLQPLLVSW